MTTRPCPVCNGNGCKCCAGQGHIPFPWLDPGDRPIQQRWTQSEVSVIYDAPTFAEAWRRYCSVYGPYERPIGSVRTRWGMHCGTAFGWEPEEIETVEAAVTEAGAVSAYEAEFGTARTRRAIESQWHRSRARRKPQ